MLDIPSIANATKERGVEARTDQNVRLLSELVPGDEATIVSVRGRGPSFRRMVELGFVRGARVRVVRVAPLGDPIEIRLTSSDAGYAVDRRLASEVLVDTGPTPCESERHRRGQRRRQRGWRR